MLNTSGCPAAAGGKLTQSPSLPLGRLGSLEKTRSNPKKEKAEPISKQHRAGVLVLPSTLHPAAS